MIGGIPKNLIKKTYINLWKYDEVLDKYPTVKKYLGNKFKKWIDNLSNPFEIDWIIFLYNDSLECLEKTLINIINDIHYSNLENLFNELPEKSKNPIEIVRKINSISAEISGYRYLKKRGYRNIEKIYEYGDWKYDNGIMSVKHKESIMDSYIYVEKIIRGLAYIQENEIIRKYSLINLNKLEGLSYKDIEFLYEYLRNYLIENLIEADKELNTFHNYQREELNKHYNNYYAKLYINSQKAYIQINLIINEHQDIRLDFSKGQSTDSSYFSSCFKIMTDKNAYWAAQIKNIKLYKDISNKIRRECEKITKPDILWIDISLIPEYTDTIRNKSEQNKYLNIINKEHRIKTILSFNIYPNLGETSVILESE